jgi:hypothetical protein
MRRHQVARWILCALVFGACSKEKDNTELVVTVWSDFAVPGEMDSLRIRVAGKDRSIDHPFQLSADGKSGTYFLPVQLGLVPAGAKDGAISITAIGERKGREMVWQQASLQFIPDQAHELVLYLAKACENVQCGENTGLTCEKGACTRSVAVKTSDLPAYTVGQTPTTPSAAVTAKPDASVPEAGAEAGQPDTLKGSEVSRYDAYVPTLDTGIPPSLGDTAPLSTPDVLIADTNRVPDLGLDTAWPLLDTAPLPDLGKLDTQRDTTPVSLDTYVCVPESDQQLCDRKGVTCGGLLGYDNCATYRSVPACACPFDAGLDTGLPDACTPESDQQLCDRKGVTCAGLLGTDNCGTYRSVPACACPSDAGLDTRLPDACAPETDQQMCGRLGQACGSLSEYDNCGQYRYVSSCGTCPVDAGWPDATVDSLAAADATPTPSGTVALFHFDGTNGSTVLTDSSGTNKVATITGNPTISTGQSKFGGASLYVDGTSSARTNYVVSSGGADFVMEGDFTLDFWVFPVGYPNAWGSLVTLGDCILNQPIGAAWNSGGSGWHFNPYYYSGAYIAAPAPSTWHHVAVTRSGLTYRAFVDGVQVYVNTEANFSFSEDKLWIAGCHTAGDNGDLKGYIDELRVVKGVAVWTSDFTPPTTPYGS